MSAFIQRLTDGGDHRLVLHDDLNVYGCPPLPEPEMVALGSCTASPISQAALDSILPLDARLQSGVSTNDLWPALLSEWLQACGLPISTGITPSASGTDLHGEWVSALSQRFPNRPTHVVSFAPHETGRGVPEQLAGANQITWIALRDALGQPRPFDQVDSDYLNAIAQAQAAQAHCLVITSDVSKTGLQAPSPSLTTQWMAAQTPGVFSLLVDACQFRCALETLRTFIDAGAWVALTGSKFMSGPSFSGLLLHRSETLDLPLPNNPGLMLRTAAALFELQRFLALPATDIAAALQAFAETVEQQLRHTRYLRLLPSPTIKRAGESWDQVPSIFLFQCLNEGNGGAGVCSFAEHQRYRNHWLARSSVPRVFLGQAVELAPEQPALRLCSSARWVVEAQEMGLERACAELASHIAALDVPMDALFHHQTELSVTG